MRPERVFLDKMIAMVEGAARKKTPNEIALQIFLIALSVIFILVTMSLYAYSAFSAKLAGHIESNSVTTLVGAAGLPRAHHHRQKLLPQSVLRNEPSQSGQCACYERQSH